MIEIRDVCKHFVTRDRRAERSVIALDRTSFTIRENEFVSIIGPSGCGKTTLLRLIGGLIAADEGEILIEGRPVTGPGPDRSIVFQNFALMPWADVLTNVAFPLQLRGVPRAEWESIAREKIRAVQLNGFEHAYPHQLSGGMQQRVGLARALAANPRVLLMDEPFGALDAQTRQLLQEELLQLWQKEKKTVLFITHAMDEAVYLSDRVVIMKPRPGRVAEVMDVPLPRPRAATDVRKTAEFTELTSYIWDKLRSLIQEEQRLRDDTA